MFDRGVWILDVDGVLLPIEPLPEYLLLLSDEARLLLLFRVFGVSAALGDRLP